MRQTKLGALGRSTAWVVVITALVACASAPPPESAETVLQRANTAMGGTALRSISFSGRGSGATFGQAFQPGMAWPKISYSSFSRLADYENAAFREDAARSRAEPTGGGGVPLMGAGEQRTTGLTRDGFAWNLVGPAPVPSALALEGRIHDLWTTPHGVIKAALANRAKVSMRREGGQSLTAVSFTVPGRFSAIALINPAGLVEQIETVQPNPVMGDTGSVISFSDYRDFGGVKFPMRIRQSMGGFPVLDLTVDEVMPNAPTGIEVPALVTTATERVTADPAAPGVWFMAGGSHNSVAIEMKDHMMLVESPLYDGRAAPLLAEVKKLGNGKPIRVVLNSHHHFDHSGGLRTAVAEGATLVTSELARPYFERILANPNWIQPDAMEKSGKKAVLTGVSGKRIFTDGERVVEVHYIESSLHAQGFMMVYLPKDKLLIEADAYTPGPPNAAPPAVPNELNLNLVQNIERLNLQVERILPLHGRMVPVSELWTAVGKKS
ncbi:MBL fold metallo-hydrolase [Rhodoferax ferrireducens]|uniref:MBL fold metallo-hydrolase n=1 Tax=Rhodoferax ferrireducens TaxID=192843 RepID=UPI000E0D06F4|nr:MBL fold metallo-hydrolase [Rhodoferax ferrireducens]